MNYDFPYPSQRMPVLARNVVATSQPLAAQAGLTMLGRGGNAVDAAIATAIALAVLEPSGNGIGSDAFAIVWDGSELHGLNASGKAPAGLKASALTPVGPGPIRGWNSVTVPGAVSAWVELSQRFGALPFEQLFEPAIRYARDGFHVTPQIAKLWHTAASTFREYPDFVAAYLPNGRAPLPGEVFRFPDQARTLERIAATAGESFYRGDIAEAIVSHAREHGAVLNESDLAEHQPVWCGTISGSYHELELHEIPPNGQGIAALIALGILEQVELSQYEPGSTKAIHLQIEAMKLAFADTYRYVADPASMGLDPTALLEPGYLAERAALIKEQSAQYYGPGNPTRGGTVYLTAADSSGKMVSFIQSNYYGFGSGIVVPGTGISLQNRAAGFSLDPNHPNYAQGGKRPFHTIIPGFLMRSGSPLASFGVMGGPMQAQGHVQLCVRLRDLGENPQAAIDAPRWQILDGLRVSVEKSMPRQVVLELQSLGHEVQFATLEETFSFGGAQMVHRIEGGYLAASDPRKDGLATGF